jgi:hypothetical protein
LLRAPQARPNGGGSGRAGDSGSGQQQPLSNGSTIAEACSVPEGSLVSYTTRQQLTKLIVGTWVLCSGPSISTTPNSVGLMFNADGSFTQLVSGDGFVTVAPDDFMYGGTWDVESDDVRNPYINANGTTAYVSMDFPTFEAGPGRFVQEDELSGDWTNSIYIEVND